MKFVKCPIENWTEMAGASELQQKLNALITRRLVYSSDVPADECLPEAEILETRTGDEAAIRDFLVGTFATIVESGELLQERALLCEGLAKEVMAVQAGQWPPVVEAEPWPGTR